MNKLEEELYILQQKARIHELLTIPNQSQWRTGSIEMVKDSWEIGFRSDDVLALLNKEFESLDEEV